MSFVSDFDAIVDCPGLSPAELGLLVYFFRNQGEGFVFLTTVIQTKFNISPPTYHKIKKRLVEDHHFIATVDVRENGKVKGCKVTVLIDNIMAAIKNSKFKKAEFNNSEFKKVEVRNIEVNKAEFNKNGHINGVNKKGSKKDKGAKAAVAAEGDRLSAPAGAAASEAVPAAAAAADSTSSEISRSPETRQSSSKAAKAETLPLSQNPPSQEDVEAAVSQIAAQANIPGWTPEAVKFKAFTIWNHYEIKKWKRADGSDLTDLKSGVFCWMKRDGFRPPVMDTPAQQSPVPASSSGTLPAQKTSNTAEKQQSFKQIERKWIERPLTDPDSFTVESAAYSIFNATCEDEVQGTLNSIPKHLHEKALALAEQMRKEQGDRPRIINNPPTFTDENEDEPS